MLQRLFFLLASALALTPVGVAFALEPFSGKTIVWVDSYEPGYAWSGGVERGIRDALEGSGVKLEIIRLDVNHALSPQSRGQAALRALRRIEEIAPDLVIASDDPAQEDLVVPYLREGGPPVVFCGVNWDASMYGYPAKNITGMVEVENVDDMVRLMRRDARGPRIGYVSGATSTDHKIASILNKRFFDGGMRAYFAEDFEEFKRLFALAQRENDMLFVRNFAGIEGWNNEEAREYLARATRIPTSSPLDFMAPFVVYCIGKSPEEQGEWAGRAALRILGGESPENIPIAENVQSRFAVNLDMARAAGIDIPPSLLKSSTVLGAGKK